MQVLRAVLRVLYRGCALASLVALVMFFIARMIMDTPSITLSQYLLIFGFALLISLAQEIFSIRRLHFAWRLLLHYAILTVSFIVIFLLAGKIAKSSATVFVYIAVFTLAYAVIVAIVFPILRATGYYQKHFSKKTDEKKEIAPYQKRYS